MKWIQKINKQYDLYYYDKDNDNNYHIKNKVTGLFWFYPFKTVKAAIKFINGG